MSDLLGGVGINKFVFVPTAYTLTNGYAEIIANINAAYPNVSNCIFMGRFTKGTEGFYILYTYSNNGQQEYPEYSVGMLMQWAGDAISSFGTVNQVPYSRSVTLTTT